MQSLKQLVGDDNKYEIVHNQSRTHLLIVAKNAEPVIVGSLTVVGSVITEFKCSEKDCVYAILKYACGLFDEKNTPLIVDQKTISTKFNRFLEDFGFRGSDDDFLVRRPYSIIPLNYSQASLTKKDNYS